MVLPVVPVVKADTVVVHLVEDLVAAMAVAEEDSVDADADVDAVVVVVVDVDVAAVVVVDVDVLLMKENGFQLPSSDAL